MGDGDTVRVKLNFADLLDTDLLKLSKCWFQVNLRSLKTIGDLTESIITKFGLSDRHSIHLTLDGFVLPKWETSHILRDNDLICITGYEHFGDTHSFHSSESRGIVRENSHGVVVTDEINSTSENFSGKYVQKAIEKKDEASYSITDTVIDIHKKPGFDENDHEKKSKMRKMRLIWNTEKDVDDVIQEELELDDNNKNFKKHSHKKRKLDNSEKELSEPIITNAALTNLQDLSGKSILREDCASAANSCGETNIVPIIIVTDVESNDTAHSSMFMGSFYSRQADSLYKNDIECMIGKSGDSPSVQNLCTFQNGNVFRESNSSMALCAVDTTPTPSSVSNGNLFDVSFATVSSAPEEKSSRKKRRTRRRKSKRVPNYMCAEYKTDDGLVCVEESEILSITEQKEAKRSSQSSQLPTQTKAHTYSTHSDSSEVDAESCGNKHTLDRLESTVVSSPDTRYENTNTHSAALIHLAHGDQTGLTESEFCSPLPPYLSISEISDFVEPSTSELSSTSSLVTGSEFSGTAQRDFNRLKNSPFANVQVFCRQKFKKMPSVLWDSCSRITLARNSSKPFSDDYCSGLKGCSENLNLDAKNSSMSSYKVEKPPVKDYAKCIALSEPPLKGNVIAYKVLEMAEDYTPCLSDFQLAEVLSYNAGTGNIQLKRISFVSKKKTPGRFDLTMEYEDQILTNTDVADTPDITVAWRNLHDVRLVEDTD